MFSQFLGRKDERTSPVGAAAAPPLIAPTPIKDSLEYIKTDEDSRKSLVDIATQILETSEGAEPAPAPSPGTAASSSDGDRVREFLNRIKAKTEYIQLLNDITKSTIENIATQTQSRKLSYITSILRAYDSGNTGTAIIYMNTAKVYFRSIWDDESAEVFEKPLREFIPYARGVIARASRRLPKRYRRTRRKAKSVRKKTRKVKN